MTLQFQHTICECFFHWSLTERADGSIQHYIEVKWKRLSESGGSHYKTSTSTVRCETSEVAEQVVILIDHARGLYNEKLHTVLATW